MAWCSGGGLAWVGDCSWPYLMVVRGFVPSPVEHRKVTLVECSCHWVTSLVGRFLRCPIMWTRFVQHLLATEPPSVGRHNGDVACWQACEPQKKIECLLSLAFSRWLDIYSSCDWFIPTRRYNHPTHLFTFLQTSWYKLFSVIRIESLLHYLHSSSWAL